ncbi:MAG: TIGR00282 family metallophosphoesterase [Patescibacteria group bacterium]
MNQIKVLVFGDVVGKAGRKALAKLIPELRSKFAPDLVIINAENLAHGRGITQKILQEMKDAGVDAFTSGHHVWENAQGLPALKDPEWQKLIIRPYNVDPSLAGKGYAVFEVKGRKIYLLNLQGQLFMTQDSSSPFLAFDSFWKSLETEPKPLVILDIHAEATSEKVALANYVDGRATLIYGTHTHVPTADAKILPQGTGFQTDVGMTGSYDSVIGFEKSSSIKRFLNLTEAPYELLDSGQAEVNGLLATLDLDSGDCVGLDRIREIVDI